MTTRPRRTWTQRLILALNVTLVLGLLTAAVALLAYNDEVGRINRIAGAGSLDQVEGPLEPVNVLLVGVDNAEGLDPDDPVLRGRREESLLSDTVMVVRVDPQTQRASLLSIPRDLWLPIAGTGSSERINAALSLGGPQMLIDTIGDELGIPINHYVQVNFAGFRNLTDVLGGIPLLFETPVRDVNSGLAVPAAGCMVLDADQALAFARSRYYEILVDGQWIADPTSDQGRIARQQVFVKAALNRAASRGARNPLGLQQMVEAAQGEVILDDALSLRMLLDLGERFRDFDPTGLDLLTLPTESGFAGAAAVAFLQQAEAQPVLALFRGQSVFGTPTEIVRVEVRNGTGVTGQASEVAGDLTDAGFTVVGTGDEPGYSGPTVLRYAPGQMLLAVLLARYLGPDVLVEPLDGEVVAGDVGVVLVTGSDWPGVAPGPLPVELFEGLIYYGQLEALAAADDGERPGPDAEELIRIVGSDGPDDGEPVSVPPVTTPSITSDQFVPSVPDGVDCR